MFKKISKKMLCVVISVLIITTLISASVVTSSATEFAGYSQNVGNGEIAVTSHQYSHFYISIPESMDTATGGEIRVTDVNLEDDYAIKVAITNLNANHCIEMSHKTKQGVTAQMTLTGNYGYNLDPNTIVKFTGNDIVNGEAVSSLYGTLNYNAPAGEYEGTVTYSIECVLDN